jgi:hypothetical protein
MRRWLRTINWTFGIPAILFIIASYWVPYLLICAVLCAAAAVEL